MFVRRLAVVGLLALASVPAVPAAARAHGSPVTPISRTAACAGNGTRTGAAACVAAREATGGRLGAYDNLRLAGVDGKDRRRVPDGQLCSGGLDAYRGLDLARDDFPATKVRSGQRLAISYRGTIPHQGSFRIYVTDPGHDPAKKLTWDDLGAEPLAEVKDPPLTDGAYRMRVRLPERTGRHILYVVWETSSTPDTYYSCSDLVFAEPVVKKAAARKTTAPPSSRPAGTAASPARSSPAAEPAGAGPAGGAASPTPEPVTGTPEPTTEAPVLVTAGKKTDGTASLGHWLIVGALTAAALVAAGAGLGRLRRRRI
ncbi:lytic polysaccharide monooxygenase [Actinoplanes sp. DH11]|uniref:lytic polysaccharide monooxygenase n=1 Tax=Actinoplanes sp. DH11 TaxID=2857011 RepID=UPI001E4540D8|nr:lytic polysaccharide monooxygenase [Actinoplanes sp. DH11]